MVQETQELLMKTFKQHLEESFVDKALGTALTFGAISAGAAGLKFMSNQGEQPQQTSYTAPVAAQVAQKPKEEEQKPKIDPAQVAHDNFHTGLREKFGSEYDVIMNAAKRNGINETDHDKLGMLFAIRKTENGRAGKEFGVLHPKAVGPKGQTLDRQAGWAASILNKRINEWQGMDSKSQSGYRGFTHYLQTRYAPHGVQNDPKGLNKHWLNNFTTHYNEHMDYLQ